MGDFFHNKNQEIMHNNTKYMGELSNTFIGT